MTTRSILAFALTGYLGATLYLVIVLPSTATNSLLLLVVGILSTNFTTVIIFYFRKAQSKESNKSLSKIIPEDIEK